MLAPTLASRAARSASESYGSKRRPQQRTHSRRQLPCTLGAVEPPLHTVLCGASAVASSSCVCVRWMERRGNPRGRGRGQWCGREGGRDNATHSQPLRSGVGEGEGAGEVCAVHHCPLPLPLWFPRRSIEVIVIGIEVMHCPTLSLPHITTSYLVLH